MDDIKVSVCMITYNHEPYIAQAVESVLAQRIDFPIEIVIGEDCSTDRTREIVQGLAESHPGIIRLRLAERNEGGKINFVSTLAECRGQYVAMLEGDDYWTCPDKLQMQIDALDGHPEWAITFHPAQCLYEAGLTGTPTYPVEWTKPVATIEDLFTSNFMPTASVVFRNGLFPAFPSWFKRIVIGDWPLHILNAVHGDIGFIPQTMSAYRVHRFGAWSGATQAAQLNAVFEMFSAIDHHFGGKYADLINHYRTASIDHVISQLDAARAQVATVEGQLRHAQAVADAQTQAYAEKHAEQSVHSVNLENGLVMSQSERQRLSDEVDQLRAECAALYKTQTALAADRATLVAENRQLKAFHDQWTNWMFYRVVREMRRPFRRTMRWWNNRQQNAPNPATTDASQTKAA